IQDSTSPEGLSLRLPSVLVKPSMRWCGRAGSKCGLRQPQPDVASATASAARMPAMASHPDRRAPLTIGAWQRQANVLDPRFQETTLAGAVPAPRLQRIRPERPLDRPATPTRAPGDDPVPSEDDGLGEHVSRLQAHQDHASSALAQHLDFVEADDQRLALARHAEHPVVARPEYRRAGRLVVGPQREEGLALAGAADEVARLADEAVASAGGEQDAVLGRGREGIGDPCAGFEFHQAGEGRAVAARRGQLGDAARIDATVGRDHVEIVALAYLEGIVEAIAGLEAELGPVVAMSLSRPHPALVGHD